MISGSPCGSIISAMLIASTVWCTQALENTYPLCAPCGSPRSAFPASTKLSIPPGPCVRSVRLIWSMQCGIQLTMRALARAFHKRTVDLEILGVDRVELLRRGRRLHRHVQRGRGLGLSVVHRQPQHVRARRREGRRGDQRLRVGEPDVARSGILGPHRGERRSGRRRRSRRVLPSAILVRSRRIAIPGPSAQVGLPRQYGHAVDARDALQAGLRRRSAGEYRTLDQRRHRHRSHRGLARPSEHLPAG